MKDMKRHILTSLAAASVFGAMAVPAKPGLLTYTQSDGSQVKVRLIGDEHHSFFMSEEGYLLDRHDNTFFFANADKDGRIERSEFKLTDSPASKPGMQAYLQSVDRDALLTRLSVARKANLAEKAIALPAATRSDDGSDSPVMRGPGLFPNSTYPVFGNQRGLVILVEYQDVSFTLDDPADYFSRMLHEEGFSDYGGTGCAREYYVLNSMGQFDPEFDVYGPVVLPHDRSYYGGNNAQGNDKKPEQMVIDACRDLDGEIDFTKYDCDGDGYVDNVFIFYAGMGEASGGPAESVWPHAWNIGFKGIRLDGVLLDRYACSNEWEPAGRPDGVGTFIHEFSHVMGLPDLYATDYTGAQTPGEWSVMDVGPYNNNGCTPPLYSAFERYALGWLEPTSLRYSASATLEPISTNKAGIFNCYRTNGSVNGNEYYLVENRQQEGWDTYLPYHGMLVWHIDYKASKWTQNIVNNDPDHQYVDLVEAASPLTMGRNPQYDPFPGRRRRTSFTDTTKPNALSWLGVESNCPIENIKETNGLITFDINGGGEAPAAPLALAATNITDDSFRANWEAEEGQTYWLSVYTYEDADAAPEEENADTKVKVYLPGYDRADMGDASFATISGLNADKEYYYQVYAGNPWQLSEPSAEIKGDGSNSSVADLVAASLRWSVDGDRLTLSGLQTGSEVLVSDIAGKVMARTSADADGSVVVAVPAHGIYLVKTAAGVLKIRL